MRVRCHRVDPRTRARPHPRVAAAASVRARAVACALALAAGLGDLAAQNGRTLASTTPVVLGRSASFTATYPAAAAGNLYLCLLTAPPQPSAQSLTLPGFTVRGLVRIDPLRFEDLFAGVLPPGGTVTDTVFVPNDPQLVGYAFDLQSVDLESATATLTFGDDEVSMQVAGPIPAGMVPIPAGTFAMGSTAGSSSEQPVHAVTIARPFWIGAREVTQAEYQALIGQNPSFFVDPLRPVESVTWQEAVGYCAALSVQEAAAGRLPTGYVYRLPTEAEWEYCCRGGSTTEWNSGASLDCTQANHRASTGFCVPHPTQPGQTSAAGAYAANAVGLHDLHGNVWEWCRDSWDGTANYPATAVVDPVVVVGASRVIRGGGFSSFASLCRSAFRFLSTPTLRDRSLGFRVVLGPELP